MLSIQRTGASIADVIASVRGVPSRMIPYAAATALTRCAKQAQTEDLPAEMRKVFSNPVPYTLNALRIEPATKDNLMARVMVKTGAHAPGVAPENFLFPEVEGGVRKHKGLEMALRYQGVLSPTQYAMPGAAAKLDAYGNVSGAQVRTILNALKGIRAASSTRDRATGTKLRKGRRLANDMFVGQPQGGGRPDGIWRREGKRLRALFVFTSDAPDYSVRLDFSGTVQRVALARFRPEFERAIADLQSKGSW